MASDLPTILSGLPDFKVDDHPELHQLFKKVTEIEQVVPFLTLLKRSKLTPKQVNYLNLPWLDGLYQAYYQVTLATNSSDTVPERKSGLPDDDSEQSDPAIEHLAFDLLMLPGDYPETMSYLLRQGLSPETTLGLFTQGYGEMYEYDSLLEVAIQRGKLKTIKVLIDAGAQVDIRIPYRENHSSLGIFEYVVKSYLQNPWYKTTEECTEDLRKLREEVDPGPDEKDIPLEERTTPAWVGQHQQEYTGWGKTREVRVECLQTLDSLILASGHEIPKTKPPV